MILYGITTCGSVKKARAFLDARGIAYTFHDLKKHPISHEKITQWLTLSDLATLLNTKGTTYRTLGLKALNLDANGLIDQMSQHNLLIKRPIIEHNGALIVGFDLSYYEGVFDGR